jgi:predicted amidohydrolase YtcJ
MHATVAGLTWNSELHWESVRSLADGLKQIEVAAKTKPLGTWIVVGGGWAPTQFTEKRLPTRAELDAVAPKHPVYVQYLRQAAVVNSTGLVAAGIDGKAADPQGGKFERDPSSRELTGVLQGVPAWEVAYAKIPRPTLDQRRQSLGDCFRELNRLGLTSVVDLHTSGVTFADRRLLADMASRGELSIRLDYYVAPNGASPAVAV